MGELRLSAKERVRMELLARVKRKEMTVVRAAELAGVSLRQMRRLWKRYRRRGEAGLGAKERTADARLELST